MRTSFIIAFFISTLSLFSQSLKPTSFALRYQNVTEYILDERIEYFIPTDTIDFSGVISIDPAKVFIKSYNQDQDKKLKIIEVKKGPGINNDMYICEMNGEVYSIFISPDRRFLYQTGQYDQFVYELSTKGIEAIYTIVEKMPLFKGATNQDESTELLYNYLEEKVNEDEFNMKGTVIVRFIVNRKGKTENIEVLRGINSKCDDKSIEYVKNMPIWTPGEQKGKKVNVQLSIAIKINDSANID